MSLPSNKIGILLLSVVVIVSAVISYNSYKERKLLAPDTDNALIETGDPIVTVKVNNKGASIDKDNDGLLDWEESLWGTDENNSDTDGDGTSDGEEVKTQRDPTVAGPNDSQDEVFQAQIASDGVYAEGYTPGTLTDNLSINLASNYLTLKKDQTYTAETGEELVTAITNDISKITNEIAEQYSVASIATFTNDKQKGKEYGTKFANIQIKRVAELKSYESYNEDVYLKILIEYYKDYARELSLLYVPQEVATAHVQIMNNYFALSQVVEDMRNYKTDPVRALLGIKTYQELSQKQTESLKKIENYFEENDILFDESIVNTVWHRY